MNSPSPPTVFVSYSHDSREHMTWVLKMAEALVGQGIRVTLDQWDTDLGDDLVRFMANSVRESDRVLVVCTDQYVRKANEGEGGVGYESMIVTGELVKDLGSKKFVPVLRQNSEGDPTPVFLSTRKYVDLTDDSSFSERIDVLARSIHESPFTQTPPLGNRPDYEAIARAAGTQPDETQTTVTDRDDPTGYIRRARSSIGNSDMPGWRAIVSQSKKTYRIGPAWLGESR